MYDVYQVRFNDTIESIANSFGITEEQLIALNNMANVSMGDFIVVPNNPSGFINYEIKKGDNLYMIAKKYGIPLDELVSLNGLDADEYIYPGEMLMIPRVNSYVTKENDTITDLLNFSNIEDLLKQNNKIYLLPHQTIFYTKE